MEVKGFFFSLDALTGLTVMLTTLILLVSATTVSRGVDPGETKLTAYTAESADASLLMQEQSLWQLNSTLARNLIDNGMPPRYASSIAETEAYLKAQGNGGKAAEQLFHSLEHRQGLKINGDTAIDAGGTPSAAFPFQTVNSTGVTRFKVITG